MPFAYKKDRISKNFNTLLRRGIHNALLPKIPVPKWNKYLTEPVRVGGSVYVVRTIRVIYLLRQLCFSCKVKHGRGNDLMGQVPEGELVPSSQDCKKFRLLALPVTDHVR